MKYTYIIIAILCITFAACKEASKNSSTPTVQSQATAGQILPPAPESLIMRMFEEVDHIDYMFRNTNFSISQDEKAACQAMISTLSPAQARMVNDSCRSPIRMTYLAQGNIMLETEMYMTPGCQYVEFIIDGKKAYHNNYSEQGYNFLLNLINQARNAGQQ